MVQFREGQRLRGRNGEMATVINGVPVPDSQPQTIQTRPADPRLPTQIEREQAGLRGDELSNIRTQQQIEEAARARAIGAQERENARVQRVTQLRQEFNGRPDVRDFMAVRDATRQLQGLREGVNPDQPGMSDIAMVFTFMKALDADSAVREGEQATARNAASVPENIRTYYNRMLNGDQLSAAQRSEMVRTAEQIYLSRSRSYNEIVRQYQPLFQDLGEDPNRHLRIAAAPGQDDARRRAAAEPPSPEGDIGFSGRTVSNDTVPLTPEQMQAYDQWMGQQRRGFLTPQMHAAAWESITGRPASNSEEVSRFFNETGRFAPAAGTSYRNFDAEEIARRRNEFMGQPGYTEIIGQGGTLGFSDEAAGVGEALRNAVTSPFTAERFDPLRSYTAGRDAEDIRIDEARRRTGLLGTVAEIGSGFGSGTIGRVMNLPATLGGRIASGARAGIGPGALAGAGYSESPRGQIDPVSTLQGAAGGAALGGVAGALVPAAVTGATNAVQLGRQLAGTDPNAARRIVAQAIEADANTPALVGEQMAQAQELGVPYMLADSGDNVRGLLAASVRAPGAGRTLARDALEERQRGLGERVIGAVERDLGPVSNPYEVQGALMDQARTQAGPLYERAMEGGSIAPLQAQFEREFGETSAALQAARRSLAEEQRRSTLGSARTSRAGDNVYAANSALRNERTVGDALRAAEERVASAERANEAARARLRQSQDDAASGAKGAVWSPRLQQFLEDPITRAGLAKGVEVQRLEALAQGREFNPTELAVTGFDEGGNPIVSAVPNMRTVDAIKRGFDELINAYPRGPSGIPELDQRGRAIEQVRKALLSEVDTLNPDYAPARAAWGGPMRMTEALDTGLGALNYSADDLAARTQRLSPPEMEMARLGLRRAMAEAMSRRVDTADITGTLVGNARRRGLLRGMFGNRPEFDRFVDTLEMERAGNETFRRATQGSPTAQNLADDSNLAASAATVMTDMAATGGIPITTGARLGFNRLANRTSAQTQEQLAALLSETDPSRLAVTVDELYREAARRRAQGMMGARRAPGYGVGSGVIGGNLVGNYAGQ